jgi:hypothetical protein
MLFLCHSSFSSRSRPNQQPNPPNKKKPNANAKFFFKTIVGTLKTENNDGGEKMLIYTRVIDFN